MEVDVETNVLTLVVTGVAAVNVIVLLAVFVTVVMVITSTTSKHPTAFAYRAGFQTHWPFTTCINGVLEADRTTFATSCCGRGSAAVLLALAYESPAAASADARGVKPADADMVTAAGVDVETVLTTNVVTAVERSVRKVVGFAYWTGLTNNSGGLRSDCRTWRGRDSSSCFYGVCEDERVGRDCTLRRSSCRECKAEALGVSVHARSTQDMLNRAEQ